MRKTGICLTTCLLLLSVINGIPAKAADDFLVNIEINGDGNWNNNQMQLLPRFAQIEKTRYQIPRSNPDKLVSQIILKDLISNEQELLSPKWNLGLWIYGKSFRCLNENDCDFILNIKPSYSNKVTIKTWKQSLEGAGETSDCPGMFSTENYQGKTIVSYSLSISCLGIPNQFASYAYSGYDLGLTSISFGYSAPGYVENPYFELAKVTYDKNGGKKGLSLSLTPFELKLQELKRSVPEARETMNKVLTRFEALAPETKKQIQRNPLWKEFLNRKNRLNQIESQLDSYSVSTNENAQVAVNTLIEIVNLQIEALRYALLFPKYQCYNISKDITKALNKNKSCPKTYTKIKT